MTRRNEVGGQTPAERRRGSQAPREPNAVHGGVDTKANIATLTRQRDEALAQQAATAEILQAISRSSFNLQSVLDTLIESATRLCRADHGWLFRVEGQRMNWVASFGHEVEAHNRLREFFKTREIPIDRGSTTGRAVLEGKAVNIPDVLTDPNYTFGDVQKAGGYRAALAAPLLSSGGTLGVIFVSKVTPQPFDERQTSLVTAFADQAVIAIENTRLLNELRQRTDDLNESLQQQTATSDVLKVISRSAFDLNAVMSTLARSASELCGASMSALYLREGDLLVARGISVIDETQAAFLRQNPLSLGEDTYTGRAVLTGATENIADTESTTTGSIRKFARALGYKAVLILPLMREGRGIGAFALARNEVGAFTSRQIELVQTFADQAVIAIENVRLFDEVQARTRDLSESLQQQTATADVLKVISRAAFDLQTVLDTLTVSAAELCNADMAAISRDDGSGFHHVTSHGFPPDWVAYNRGIKLQPGRGSVVGRALLDSTVIQVDDVLTDSEYTYLEPQKKAGYRTFLAVPLLRGGQPIGVISLGNKTVRPFSDKQIGLVQTFADQAVIAIENVRLFDEVQARTRDLTESLLQQTATADVLKVISRSAFDLQPVLDSIVETASRLCEAEYAFIYKLQDDGKYHMAANHGADQLFLNYAVEHPLKPGRGSLVGRTALERKTVHMPDCLADPEYVALEYQSVGQYRSNLGVPLLREGVPIGVIILMRAVVIPFTERQIELVTTFADQAVIAIENARLFNETKEALERQTATADILKVIASSPDDVQPVFEAIAERSNQLVNGLSTGVYSLADDIVHLMAFTPVNPAADRALREAFPRPMEPSALEAVRRGESFSTIDSEVEFATRPDRLKLARLRGWRSSLGVPLMHDGKPIGLITVTRVTPGGFDDHYVQLLKTFADQAVIAISNVRLFKEVQERTRELSQSLDDLRAAQDRLVQTEKLASLGQLTAGIAHEIKNPLNFVNNFSALSAELTEELNDTLKPVAMDGKVREEVDGLTSLLKGNLQKVVQHGKRADSIVKNMLLHSREGSGEHRSTDINALVAESLNLAYHGARAEKPGFNVIIKRDLDPDAGAVELYPQEITRALLNLISNGFYAATQRKAVEGETFEPTLIAVTKNLGKTVEIRIRDNGTGIPDEVKEKIFNPFFTTKPSGEGTGLGLSMSHDIVVKQHGGSIEVDTEPGLFTEFKVVLPRISQR